MTTIDSQFDSTADARPDAHRPVTRIDAAFDALATRGCQELLVHLVESGELAVEELAARVAAEDDESSDDESRVEECAEDDADASDVGDDRDAEATDSAVDRMRAHLHHVVLPKLDGADLVDYDREEGRVAYRSDSEFEAMATAVEESESADVPVPLDVTFDLLSDRRRRAAYQTLLVHDDLSLPDLADEVAVALRDQPLPEIDPDAVLRVYLSLYHTHVPKLASAGLVTYDQDDDYVALTESGRALEPSVRTLLDAAGK